MAERKVPQQRWECGHCGTEGWWTPSQHIGDPPYKDHDRPDGRKCRKAQTDPLNIAILRLRKGTSCPDCHQCPECGKVVHKNRPTMHHGSCSHFGVEEPCESTP